MKVKELIKQLLDKDINSEVYIRYNDIRGEDLFLEVDGIACEKHSCRGNVTLQASD
jgi:hypothetical protein